MIQITCSSVALPEYKPPPLGYFPAFVLSFPPKLVLFLKGVFLAFGIYTQYTLHTQGWESDFECLFLSVQPFTLYLVASFCIASFVVFFSPLYQAHHHETFGLG
jgi:hypothetical protein